VTPAGTSLTILNVIGSASIRLKLTEFEVSSDSAPADVASKMLLSRTTAVGTGGTGVTPVAVDPLTVAATATATGGTFSGEPTYAATGLYQFAFNQRSTFRWIAAPGFEFVSTATAANGISMRSVASGATPNIDYTAVWFE
jgi:hypothetical protein